MTKAIDLRGLSQPFPSLLLHLKLEEVKVGQIVEVITSGSTAEREVDLYCRASGNELLDAANKFAANFCTKTPKRLVLTGNSRTVGGLL